METLILSKRIKKNNRYAKKERKRGLIPGVLYGKNLRNYMFEIGELELNKAVFENGEFGVLDLNCEGQSLKALIKEVQREPVNHKIIHIDLQEVNNKQIVETEVPIVYQNEGLVYKNGGLAQKEKNSIKLQCNVEKLPKSIEIDLGNLKVGDVLRMTDVELSKELIPVEEMDTVIVTIISNQNINTEEEK
ncbi:50S ribosomal protein L25 [Haloimpatiens sp. FM7315]|uniref:50S ribosomal protein L25 n=1 Tax=Haloimpatiens sp. FM7315 TaxID=3298609 RepID=UPI003977B8C6